MKETIWDKPIVTGRWAEMIEGYEMPGCDYHAPVRFTEFEAALFAHSFKHDSDAMAEALGSVEELVRIAEKLRQWLVMPGLPEEFYVWHGGPAGVTEDRINWTRHPHVAETFAKYEVMMRGFGTGEVLLGKVKRDNVLMALPDDIEHEIVVRPGTVAVEFRQPVPITPEQIAEWREEAKKP